MEQSTQQRKPNGQFLLAEDIFLALGSLPRMKICRELRSKSIMNPNALQKISGASKPSVSQNLRILLNANLVTYISLGRSRNYSLTPLAHELLRVSGV